MLSNTCPGGSHVPGYSFETHTECVEFGYRLAHGTFKDLEKMEEMETEYIENSRIVVKFECKPVQLPKQIVPPPKPKSNA
tara:strand:+ start:1015 stop:1254 length:240 start_codon:yes stop_codon:yes gene_type:complete